jgi:hypothetical protein
MNVIIAGGRNFKPCIKHSIWIQKQLLKLNASIILSGGCSGADKFGEDISKIMRLKVKIFTADWNKYGGSAGPMRNDLMAMNADACILFPGGKGTNDMRNKAIKHNLILIEYKED